MLVPHGDVPALSAALRTALTDPDATRQMSLAAGRLAQGWDWPSIGRRYEALLTDVATGIRSAPGAHRPAGLQHAAL